MIDTVIFDMDGVIVDSELYWKTADIDLIRSFAPEWNEKYENHIVGLNLSDLYMFVKNNFTIDITENQFRKFYDYLANVIYSEKVSLLPNFNSFLHQIKKDKFKIAIASSSPRNWINIVLDRFSLSAFFDKTISVEETTCKGKPHPDIYLHTAKLINKNPEQCIVIEDSRNGVLAAKSAGIKCIGLRNGFNDEQDLSKADLVTNNFSELSIDKIRSLS